MRPATWVPRMPMVATGVRTSMFSGTLSAISPVTKTKTPSSTETIVLPSPVPGSKTISSTVMRASSSRAKIVPSMKTTLSVDSGPVERMSPSKPVAPSMATSSVPSPRMIKTSPVATST